MIAWNDGTMRVFNQLESWLTTYTVQWCRRKPGDDHDDYTSRIWRCWSYHWKQAAEASETGLADGWEVAERLCQGRGAVGGGNLGGNPLADVVLAEAVQKRDEVARANFHAIFRDFALAQAASVARHLRDDDHWWNDLVGKLAGDVHPPGKLASYSGKCGLQNWLGTVVRREAQAAPPPVPQPKEGGPRGRGSMSRAPKTCWSRRNAWNCIGAWSRHRLPS
jgi:hypothetical protein